MNPLFLIALAIGGFLVMKGVGIGTPSASTSTASAPITRSNPWNLPDIDSANQCGVFSTTYDESFEKASGATGVPFALIKAHAIRESSLSPTAYHYDNPTSGASYGLMQTEWVSGNDRFAKYGFPDSILGSDGSGLYDPDTSAFLGASIIAANLGWLDSGKTMQGLRDTINSYNTGTPESGVPAPANYVNDVLGNYATLLGQPVTV